MNKCIVGLVAILGLSSACAIYSVTFLAVLLASLSALQAAESPAPLADQERMPAFSWDRVPLYVHIRKDTAFTDEEIRYLATFPLITFEKATGHKDSGSVEAGTLKAARAVKAINPATKILYYRNVIVHYGGYAANTSLKRFPGPFWSAAMATTNSSATESKPTISRTRRCGTGGSTPRKMFVPIPPLTESSWTAWSRFWSQPS